MNNHDKPSAESVGNEGNPEDEFEFIGTRGLSERLLEDVTELMKKYVKDLPKAVECDRDVESQFFQGKMHQFRQHLREGTLPEDFDPFSYD